MPRRKGKDSAEDKAAKTPTEPVYAPQDEAGSNSESDSSDPFECLRRRAHSPALSVVAAAAAGGAAADDGVAESPLRALDFRGVAESPLRALDFRGAAESPMQALDYRSGGAAAVDGGSADAVSPAWKSRPKRARARRVVQEPSEEEGSEEEGSEEEGSEEEGSKEEGSEEDKEEEEEEEEEGSEWGEEHEEEEAAPPRPQPRPIARGTSKLRLPATPAMASVLAADAGLSGVAKLASQEHRVDVDGFSAVFVTDDALDALDATLGGARHAVDPIGAEYAKQRGLYDPDTLAMMGLASPRERLGMGVCIERNKYARPAACLTTPSRALSLPLSSRAAPSTPPAAPPPRHASTFWCPQLSRAALPLASPAAGSGHAGTAGRWRTSARRCCCRTVEACPSRPPSSTLASKSSLTCSPTRCTTRTG